MKWIKHQANSWDDERIAALVGNGGKDGLAMYGAYWRVQEILAAQMDGPDPSCAVQYSVSRWSVLLSIRGSHVSHYLGQLAEKGLVTVEWIGSDIRVTNRKLLKYRDEYSRKSGHAPENVPPRREQIQNRANTDTDTKAEPDNNRITEPPMVASAVLDDLRLSGRDLRIVLDEVCAREMRAGADPEELRRSLVDAWRSYEQAKPRLTYSVGAAKFFGESWRNPAGWPWDKQVHELSIDGWE